MNFAIDIVSDFVCPWCFLGKSRMTKAMALAQEKHPALRFQLNWLPYFLGPDVPQAGQPYRAYLEGKFGGAKPVESAQQRVIDAGAEDGVEPASWRAVLPLRGRLVTLSAAGPADTPLPTAQGRALIEAFAARMRSANR